MLSRYLKFMFLCWCCGFSLDSHGQVWDWRTLGNGGNGGNGGNINGQGGSTIGPVNIIVDRNAIESRTASSIITVQLWATNNSMPAVRDALSGAKLRMVANKGYNNHPDIPAGLFFRPMFGKKIERNFGGNEANLFMDNDNNTVADLRDIQNSYREAKFEFYIKPESIPSGLKPGKYQTTYLLYLEGSSGHNVFYRNEFSSNPKPLTVTIEVLPYLIVRKTGGSPVQIDINALSAFENGYKGKSAERVRQSYQVKHNVPFNATLTAGTSTLAFTNKEERNNITPVGTVNSIIKASDSQNPSVSSLGKPLSNAPGQFDVAKAPFGNVTNVTLDFEISPENLKTHFLKFGNYLTEANLAFKGKDASTTGMGSSFDINPIEVRTSELRELTVNQNSVDIAFRNQTDYEKGVSVEVPNNISYSSTSKYKVTVRSRTETFMASAGGKAVLKSSLLSIGAGLSGSGGMLVELGTNPQPINLGNPVLNANSNIRYTVRPSIELLKAKEGTYTIEVIYGITAQ